MAQNKKIAIAAALATLLAVPAEGLRTVAYRDPPGVLTVCYGSTTDVQQGKVYTLDECRARLDADMLKAVIQVDRCVPDAPPAVLVAFSDSVYNLGPKIACDTRPAPLGSTAARKLAAKDWVGACQELPKWDKARVLGVMVALPGLTKRREKARQVCMSGFV